MRINLQSSEISWILDRFGEDQAQSKLARAQITSFLCIYVNPLFYWGVMLWKFLPCISSDLWPLLLPLHIY